MHWAALSGAGVLRRLWEHCTRTAGGTLTAVRAIVEDDADVAMFWSGGRHHAKKYGPLIDALLSGAGVECGGGGEGWVMRLIRLVTRTGGIL